MAVMEHGALKILCVSADLGMRTDRCYVLVSCHPHSDETGLNLDVCSFAQLVKQVNIVPVETLPASHVLPTLW